MLKQSFHFSNIVPRRAFSQVRTITPTTEKYSAQNYAIKSHEDKVLHHLSLKKKFIEDIDKLQALKSHTMANEFIMRYHKVASYSSKQDLATDLSLRTALLKLTSKALQSKLIESLPNIADTMAKGGIRSQTLWDNITALMAEHIEQYSLGQVSEMMRGMAYAEKVNVKQEVWRKTIKRAEEHLTDLANNHEKID